jgi:hypothetical protein
MASDDPPDVGYSSPSSSTGRRGTLSQIAEERARTFSSRSGLMVRPLRRWPTAKVVR